MSVWIEASNEQWCQGQFQRIYHRLEIVPDTFLRASRSWRRMKHNGWWSAARQASTLGIAGEKQVRAY
jgi:hypothetical protein